MKKLSQKELLNEGFGSMVKGLARGAAGLAKGTAKMISPTAAKVAKSAADKVGGAIGNVLSSPTAAIKEYFNRPEVRSKYDNLVIGKETKLNNFRRQIELEFRDVRKGEQVKTTAEAYRTDEGGTSPETWSFEKIKTPSGGEIGPNGKGGDKKGGGKAGELIDDTLRGIGGLGVDAAKGLGGLGVDAAKGTGDLVKKGTERVATDEYEDAKEMPSRDEWEQLPEDEKWGKAPPQAQSQQPQAQEEPQVQAQPEEEPQPEEPQVKKEKSTDKKNVIRRVRRALNIGEQPRMSDLEALRNAGVKLRDRVTFTDPETGEKVSRELRALLNRKNLGECTESMHSNVIIEKSQKSLLKHLQSLSR